MPKVTIGGQQFIKTRSCGDGNCFLYTLLNYLNAKGIDPFLDMVPLEQQTSVQVYREFLVKDLVKGVGLSLFASKAKLHLMLVAYTIF